MKVFFIGDQDSGKTSLVHNLLQNGFSDPKPTEGVISYPWQPFADSKYGKNKILEKLPHYYHLDSAIMFKLSFQFSIYFIDDLLEETTSPEDRPETLELIDLTGRQVHRVIRGLWCPINTCPNFRSVLIMIVNEL